jgi:hypothetical protein
VIHRGLALAGDFGAHTDPFCCFLPKCLTPGEGVAGLSSCAQEAARTAAHQGPFGNEWGSWVAWTEA